MPGATEIREALEEGRIRSILFVRTGRVGDVLFVTPLLRRFHETYDSVKLSVLTSDYARRVLEHHPLLARVFSYNPKCFRPLRRRGLRRLARQLGQHRFDLVVFLSETTPEADCLRGSDVRYYFRAPPPEVGRADLGRHVIEQFFERMAPLGLSAPPGPMEIFHSAAEERTVDTFLERSGVEPGERFAVVHPGCFQVGRHRVRASLTTRRVWPAARFEELAARLESELGLRVILSGSGRRELRILRRMARRLPGRPVIAARFDILELAALVERASLFVSVDTGPMHVAAAVKTPLIALFGPSPVHLTRPWGDGPQVTHWEGADLACSPCRGRKIPCFNNVCMKRITVDSVLASAAALLASQASVS